MANNCLYTMKIIGNSKENVDKFVGMLTYENKDKYFARIFSADPYDAEEKNGRYSIKVAGDCAWSVHGCMCGGPWSYYEARSATDEHLTNLHWATGELGLTVEIFSQEPGIGFAEHYIYDNGKCLVEEETDFQEYWDDGEFDSIEDFMDEYGLDLPPEKIRQLEEEGYVTIGGFDEVFTIK